MFYKEILQFSSYLRKGLERAAGNYTHWIAVEVLSHRLYTFTEYGGQQSVNVLDKFFNREDKNGTRKVFMEESEIEEVYFRRTREREEYYRRKRSKHYEDVNKWNRAGKVKSDPWRFFQSV